MARQEDVHFKDSHKEPEEATTIPGEVHTGDIRHKVPAAAMAVH